MKPSADDLRIVLKNRQTQLETLTDRLMVYEYALQQVQAASSLREAHQLSREALGVVRGEREKRRLTP